MFIICIYNIIIPLRCIFKFYICITNNYFTFVFDFPIVIVINRRSVIIISEVCYKTISYFMIGPLIKLKLLMPKLFAYCKNKKNS